MRLNLTLKFIIPLFVILAITAGILSYQASSVLKQEVINHAKDKIVDFVQIQSRLHITSPSDFSLADPQKTQQAFDALFGEIKTPEVLRIKVWDRNGTVIYSDNKEIVGKNFADNDAFKKAIAGTVAVDIGQPTRPENFTEKRYKQLMEVYVPIELSEDSGPIGVVETYYKLDRLNESIKSSRQRIIFSIMTVFLIIGIVMWILFYFLVIKRLQKLEAGIKEIEKRGGALSE